MYCTNQLLNDETIQQLKWCTIRGILTYTVPVNFSSQNQPKHSESLELQEPLKCPETYPLIRLELALQSPSGQTTKWDDDTYQSVKALKDEQPEEDSKEKLRLHGYLNFQSSSWYKLWFFPYLFWQKLLRWKHASMRMWLHWFFLKAKLLTGLQNKALRTPCYQYFQLI